VKTETVPGDVALHLEVDGPDPATPPDPAAAPPTLCLLHGFGGSARNWRPQARALRERARVAAFDVRGHARSEAPEDPEAYTPACFVADVARVLDHLGVPRRPPGRSEAAVIGGLSMGAGIAARFAEAHPERVRGLVLAALAPGARSARNPDTEGTRQHSWALAFADAIEREGLEAAGARYAWGPESGLDPAAAKMVRLGFLEHAPHAVAHTLRRLLAQQAGWREIADALQPLLLPLLVIVGERDRVSRGACEQLAAALPDATLVVVPGAGHVVNLEAREAVSDAIAAFLDALPGAPPARAPGPAEPAE
jgi:pimeloyl-ACP methyl ester carboxylesterase